MIESPGGVLFMQDGDRGPFMPAASWSSTDAVLPECLPVGEQDDLVAFLARREWVVDLREYRASPGVYGSITLPEWLQSPASQWRIISPL